MNLFMKTRLNAKVFRQFVLRVLSLFVLVLIGCTNNDVAGGSSGHENVIQVSVHDASGEPVAARVYIVSSADWNDRIAAGEPVVLDSLDTENGVVFLSREWLKSNQHLFARTFDRSEVFWGRTSGLVMDSLIRTGNGKHVSWSSAELAGQQVGIKGTPLLSMADSSGNLFLQDVPRDLMTLGVVGPDRVWNSIAMVDAKQEQTKFFPVENHEGVLVSDFDKGLSVSDFYAWTGGGWWWAVDDRREGGNSRVLPAGVYASITNAVDSAGAWDSLSLHVTVQRDPDFPRNYAVVGFDLGKGVESGDTIGVFKDLSALTAIEFMAKGNGELRVEVSCTDEPFVLQELPLAWSHQLSATWEKVTVLPESLQSYAEDASRGLSWENSAKNCAYIGFSAADTAEFWLDDVYLRGIELRDLD